MLDVESPPVGNDPLGLHYIKTLHESILKLFRLFQTKDPKVFKYERFHFNVGNRYNLRWLNFRGSVSTCWYFNGIPVIHVNVCKGFTQVLQHLHSHIQCMCDLSFKNRYLIIVNLYMPSGTKMGKKIIYLYNCCCIVKLLFEMCIPVTYKNKNMSIVYMQIINFCDNLKMKSLVYIIMIKYHQGRLMTV